MITLIHNPPTRSSRVLWLIEEMGLPCKLVSFKFGSEPPPEFRHAAALAQLPAILDGDVTMIESVAIMMYLMEKYGPTDLKVAPSEPDFPQYLQFMEYGEAGLMSIGNALIMTHFRAPEEEKRNWTAKYIRDEMARRLSFAAKRIEGREYLAADRFTAADICVGYALAVYRQFELGAHFTPALNAYLDRLMARPAFERAFAPSA